MNQAGGAKKHGRVSPKNTGRGKKEPFIPFYIDDYTTDKGIRKSSLAARGLWVEILFIMWKEPVRGVLVEDAAGLGDLLGKTIQEIAPLLHELHRNGVYSTGEEMNAILTREYGDAWPEGLASIHPNAIVNRRQYRAHVLGRLRAMAGKKGGRGNGKQIENKDEANPPDGTIGNKKTYPTPDEAKPKQTPDLEQDDRTRARTISVGNSADTNRSTKGPASIAGIIGSAELHHEIVNNTYASTEALVNEITALTREPVWADWWTSVVTILDGHRNGEGITVLREHMTHIATALNELQRDLKGVGSYRDREGAARDLVKKTTTWMRRNRLQWPNFPTAKQGART